MSYYEVLPIGILKLRVMTVAEVTAIDSPENGMVAFVSDEGTSGACVVAYQDTAWIVVETGAAMA